MADFYTFLLFILLTPKIYYCYFQELSGNTFLYKEIGLWQRYKEKYLSTFANAAAVARTDRCAET